MLLLTGWVGSRGIFLWIPDNSDSRRMAGGEIWREDGVWSWYCRDVYFDLVHSVGRTNQFLAARGSESCGRILRGCAKNRFVKERSVNVSFVYMHVLGPDISNYLYIHTL